MALFQGQAMDLFWTYNSRCPTMNEYYRMVDNSKRKHRFLGTGTKRPLTSLETGQLFSIVTRLMLDNHKCISTKTSAALDKFTTLLGRYFQVRDDYQNLASADVSITIIHVEYQVWIWLTSRIHNSTPSKKAFAKTLTRENTLSL